MALYALANHHHDNAQFFFPNHNDVPYHPTPIVLPNHSTNPYPIGTPVHLPSHSDQSSIKFLAGNNTKVDVSNHGYHGEVNITNPTDSGNINFKGNIGGDWHGHNNAGTTVSYHDDSGWMVGGGASIGPNSAYSVGGTIGFQW